MNPDSQLLPKGARKRARQAPWVTENPCSWPHEASVGNPQSGPGFPGQLFRQSGNKAINPSRRQKLLLRPRAPWRSRRMAIFLPAPGATGRHQAPSGSRRMQAFPDGLFPVDTRKMSCKAIPMHCETNFTVLLNFKESYFYAEVSVN